MHVINSTTAVSTRTTSDSLPHRRKTHDKAEEFRGKKMGNKEEMVIIMDGDDGDKVRLLMVGACFQGFVIGNYANKTCL